MAGRSKKITIRTKLGEREIARDSIIYFPHGLIGLDDKREFVLLQVRENSPFLLLQCVTDAGLGLQAPQVDAKHPTHYRLVDGQRPQKPAPE